nr:hypothetical protein [Tanacetum cinerariifolium]
IKTINDDVRLQALIDGEKVVINKASIRHDLKLNDTEVWQKNLEAGVPFYMFPRFIQVFVDHQLGDMSYHKGIFINPSLTKKAFANMKRVGTWFSGTVTPLFGTIMVQALKEVGDIPNDVQGTPIPNEPSSSQPQRKHKPRRKQRMETKVSPTETNTEDPIPIPSNDPLTSGEDRMQLKRLMELCTNLSNKVLDLENEVIEIKCSHKANIEELEIRVEKLEEENRLLTKELKSFNTKVKSPTIKETVMDKAESSKHGRKIIDIDTDVEDVIKDVEDVVTTAETVEAQARKNMMIYLKNMAGYKMEYFKGMSYEQIRPIFEMEYNKVQAYLNKGPEMDAERIKAPRKRTRKEKVEKDQPAKKQKGNELEHDNAKKQKLEEQEEAKELKKNLEIVPDDEDDVFVNVTSLSSKPPTIMDYKIYKEKKKEHFHIIRANGNHHMYLAFSIMLKNFDREDLEVL